MRRFVGYIVTLSLVMPAWLLGGCTREDYPRSDELFSRSPIKHDDRLTMVRLNMSVVEVPLGWARDSAILWSLVNTDVTAMDEAVSLAANGIRVGVGKKEDFHAIEDVLVDLSAQQYVPRTVPGVPGAPVPIIIQQHQEPRTIFLVHSDNTISGLDYPPGNYILSMLFTLDPDGRTMTVTTVPQVESFHRRPVIEDEGNSAAIVRRADIYTLYPMTFQMRLVEGDFIVIGASEHADRPTSIGQAFLIRNRAGVPVETLLLITPEIITPKIIRKGD